MIEDRYKPQAQRAADLYYTLLGAVEDCGADEELTALVVRLADDHRKIRALFGLDPTQVVRVIRADDIYPMSDGPCGECGQVEDFYLHQPYGSPRGHRFISPMDAGGRE